MDFAQPIEMKVTAAAAARKHSSFEISFLVGSWTPC